MKNYFLCILLFTTQLVFAQHHKQNIRGVVLDKLTQSPVAGASVLITNHVDSQTAVSDKTGNFIFTGILPDRYEIKVSAMGYELYSVPDIIVTSGKEVILDIAMEEQYKKLTDVVVTSSGKESTLNKFATASARSFSMEEVNRYAGGRSDPARLVANFAGVSAPDDARNDIVIRGNSPVGLLWRIDGMNVTNPNHFATVGTTGGAVSALNTNLLKSSDFFTSAFPAEYGNATSGVFDLGFRNGNTQKRETTLQLGFITGLEATTEGPISKSNNSSYLIGYRYSLAGMAQAIGINIGTPSTPSYQDLSFKINSGDTKLGKFTLVGILATSNINLSALSSGSNNLYSTGYNTSLVSDIGILGLKNEKKINKNSFLSTSIGWNYSKNTQSDDSTDRAGNSVSNVLQNNTTNSTFNVSTSYNTRINARLFVKVGIQDELMNLNLHYTSIEHLPRWTEIWNTNTTTSLVQLYAESKYRASEKLTFNIGVHAQKLYLNDHSVAVEPRFGMKYDLTNNSNFTLAYGLHSQMQPVNIYFNQNPDGSYNSNNMNLGFNKSEHFVLGYNIQPIKNWRIKAEIYYQYLFNVAVDSASSSYSMLNTGSTFAPDLETNLTNKGTGKNYGAELTIEKFFSEGYYGLLTGSLYQSKYRGSDGIERNTAYNGKYVYNLLVGKEYKTGFEKRNSFNMDVKLTRAGGRYYTPIDLVASQATGHQQLYGDAYTNSAEYPDYFRLDFKVGYSFNSKQRKLSQTFSLDIQNITNHQNVYTYGYDTPSNSIKATYQLGLFPNFTYKLQF